MAHMMTKWSAQTASLNYDWNYQCYVAFVR